MYGIYVALPHASQLEHQWEQDELLMDLFLRQGTTDADEKSLNRICRHLHVYVLSDRHRHGRWSFHQNHVHLQIMPSP